MKGLNFKNLIEIWNVERGYDELGNPINGWQETTKAWADIKTMKGREYFAASTAGHVGVIRFIIRYIPGVHEGSRIMYNKQPYKLVSVTNDDAHNRTITMIAETIREIDQ